jgi:hypothetical protein
MPLNKDSQPFDNGKQTIEKAKEILRRGKPALMNDLKVLQRCKTTPKSGAEII